MAELVPFLNKNPTAVPFLLGKYQKLFELRVNGEVVRLSLSIGGRIVHQTGDIRMKSLDNHYSEYNGFHRSTEKVKLLAHYSMFLRGFPYSATFSVPNPPRFSSKSGKLRVVVSGRFAAASGFVQKARTRGMRFMKNPVLNKRAFGMSTPTRPKPERITQFFLRTEEFSAGPTSNQTAIPVTMYFRDWTGTRTPGFGKLKKRGLPDNAHSVRLTMVTQNRSMWHQVQPASGGYLFRDEPYSNVYSMPDSPTLVLPQAEFKALQRLISRSEQGINSNIAQNIAQISQLSQMIIGNATVITKAMLQLKSGNIPGAVGTLLAGKKPKWFGAVGKPSVKKSLASNWLELQYGWKPLLDDINGLFVSLSKLQGPTDCVQRVSSSATSSSQFKVAFPPANSEISGSQPGSTYFTVMTTHKFKLRYKVSSPFTAFLGQTGFTNPINLTWELLPFSFVVDWFIPIGGYLESLSAWDGCTFLGGCSVSFTRIRAESGIASSGPAVGEPTVLITHTATQSREEVRLARGVLESFPSQVAPSFNSHGLEAGNRASNAIALLTQAFR